MTMPTQPHNQAAADNRPAACPVKPPWLRRVGFAGFMFFFIKGLMWLTAPAAIAIWRGCAA